MIDTKKLPVKTYSPKNFAWTKWKPKDFKDFPKKAIEEIKNDYAVIKKIPAKERTFENTLVALERAGKVYGEKLGFVGFLAEVSPEKEVREAAQKVEEEYSKKIVDIIYDKNVYRAVKEYTSRKEKLDGEKRILFEDTLRSYKRMGFDLSDAKQKLLKINLKELSKLGLEFRKNINNYKDHITLSKEESWGLGDIYLNGLKKDKKGNYIVTLEYPDIGPFLENSPNDEKRKEITDKNMRKGGIINIKVLEKMIKLRHENSGILGYKSFAHYAIEERMAKKPETVMSFLKNIEKKIIKSARKEREEVLELKREIKKDKKAKYEYFDSYYVNQLKKKKYSVDNEKIREYFPFEKVKSGMFEIYQTILGVKFEKLNNYPLWHEDVELYAVKDGGGIISYFAMDLFPRVGKYGHAAAFPLINGREEDRVYIAPLASLVCNFPKPTKEIPSLLSHNEVETFFHEFGHIMHDVLTKARYESQSGFSVAWDFVEMPSQMLENWTWNGEMLKKMSGHYKTGEPLPNELVNKMLKAKNFMIASHYLRQMFLALYDMELHYKKTKGNIANIYGKMAKNILNIELPKTQLYPAGFGHIGAGYAAGYYSYAWAENYAADMFTRFEKEGLLNKKTGADYRKWILEKGSSMKEIDLIKGFLGRAPNNKAFLRHIGVLK